MIRAMPNTPLMVGEGCVAYCPGKQATQDDMNLVQTMFQVMGMCEEIPESVINAFGALAGSGPAFVRLWGTHNNVITKHMTLLLRHVYYICVNFRFIW